MGILRTFNPVFIVFALLFAIAPAYAAPVVLFDGGHKQQFHSDREGDLDLSGLASLFKDEGFDLRTSSFPLTGKSLDGIDVLVISGPFAPLSPDEIEAVARFVEEGGALCVMLHIAQPLGTLLHRLNVDFANGVIRESENVIDGESLNFRVFRLEPHPLTEGLEGFAVYGGWAVRNTDESIRILASTSPNASIDLNGDRKGDAVQSFGVLVAGEIGKGRFAVFGDDAIFQNRFLKGENLRLGKNLARWLNP